MPDPIRRDMFLVNNVPGDNSTRRPSKRALGVRTTTKAVEFV